jgi:hypothetical protein
MNNNKKNIDADSYRNDFTTTGALLTPPQAVKGKRGFQPVKGSELRSEGISFRMKAKDIEFINAYCKKYDITKTELFLRSLNLFTGYDGKKTDKSKSNP